MRTVIDLTEDGSYHDALLPDHSSISLDGDDVSFQLREVELRMTIAQFCGLSDAFNKWLFRGMSGEQDLNQDFVPAAEHERLRLIIRKMRDERVVGGTAVPEAVCWALMHALREEHVDVDGWRDQHATIIALQQENQELRDQLAGIKPRARIKAPKEKA